MMIANVNTTAIYSTGALTVRTRQYFDVRHQHSDDSGDVMNFRFFAMREFYYGKDNFKTCN